MGKYCDFPLHKPFSSQHGLNKQQTSLDPFTGSKHSGSCPLSDLLCDPTVTELLEPAGCPNLPGLCQQLQPLEEPSAPPLFWVLPPLWSPSWLHIGNLSHVGGGQVVSRFPALLLMSSNCGRRLLFCSIRVSCSRCEPCYRGHLVAARKTSCFF